MGLVDPTPFPPSRRTPLGRAPNDLRHADFSTITPEINRVVLDACQELTAAGKNQEALAHLELLIRSHKKDTPGPDPLSAEALRLCGEIKLEQGDLTEALAAFRRAAAEFDSLGESFNWAADQAAAVWLQAATAAYHGADFAAARNLLKTAAERAINNDSSHEERARLSALADLIKESDSLNVAFNTLLENCLDGRLVPDKALGDATAMLADLEDLQPPATALLDSFRLHQALLLVEAADYYNNADYLSRLTPLAERLVKSRDRELSYFGHYLHFLGSGKPDALNAVCREPLPKLSDRFVRLEGMILKTLLQAAEQLHLNGRLEEKQLVLTQANELAAVYIGRGSAENGAVLLNLADSSIATARFDEATNCVRAALGTFRRLHDPLPHAGKALSYYRWAVHEHLRSERVPQLIDGLKQINPTERGIYPLFEILRNFRQQGMLQAWDLIDQEQHSRGAPSHFARPGPPGLKIHLSPAELEQRLQATFRRQALRNYCQARHQFDGLQGFEPEQAAIAANTRRVLEKQPPEVVLRFVPLQWVDY